MHARTIAQLAATGAFLTLTACGASAGTASNTTPPGSVAGSTSTPTPATASATSAATPVPTAPPLPTAKPPTAKPPTAAPKPSMAPAPKTAAVVMSASTSAGMALVADSNGRTVYTFNSDAAGTGRTNCNSGCDSEWPPLTIAAGSTPTAGPGVAGHLGTLVRTDGRIQVTYNGLALYFFAGDSGPAQTNGMYPGWSLSKP
jgi:predicted lipoprotein with Yx(FWY)xxD motif